MDSKRVPVFYYCVYSRSILPAAVCKKRQDERKAFVIIAVTKDTILYMCLKRKMFYRKRANSSFQKKRGNIEKSFSIRKRNDRTSPSITSNPRIEKVHQKASSLSSQLLDEVSLKATCWSAYFLLSLF